MEKQLLEELNRTREIMGLEILIEQEKIKQHREEPTPQVDAEGLEMQKKIEGVINEIVGMFSQIDPAEREEFKKAVIGALKGDRFKVDDEDKEEVIKRLLDEFKKIEKQPIEEAFLLERRRRPNWKRWLKNTFWKSVNLLTLNMVSFKRRYNRFTWWKKSWVTVRHSKKAKSGKMSSLGEMTPETKEADWQEYFEKYNKKFKRKIVKGADKWDESWNKYELVAVVEQEDEVTEEGKDYTYRPVMMVALETYNSFDKYGRRKVKIIVSDKPKQTKKEIKRDPKFEAKEFSFPANGQPSADFFEDNEFTPTQAFKDNFQTEIIEPLKKEALELKPPEGKPAYWLRTLGIATSCSARNNGESSDGVTRTWIQLAEARAQAGLEYIKEQLLALDPPMAIGSNGGDQETEFVINAKGENFGKMAADNVRKLDGTSGPVMDDKPDNWDDMTTEDQEAWEKDNKDIPGYEKYKYFNVAFDIILNTTTLQENPDDPDFEFIYTDKLAISYDIPPRDPKYLKIPGLTWKLPQIKWAFPFFSWFKGIFTKKPSTTDCPKFW